MTTLLILLPLFAVVLLNVLPKSVAGRICACLTLAVYALQMYFSGIAFLVPASVFTWSPFSVIVPQTLDALSATVLFSSGLVAFCSTLTARGFFKDSSSLLNFANLALIALIGMNAVAVSKDLFSIYVFIEVAAIGSFVLIAMQKSATELEGAFKYLVMSAIASALMLLSIGLLLIFSGGVSFSEIGLALTSFKTSSVAIIAVALFLCGTFIKSGVMPFHGWLPDAYSSAKAPASILLAGIVTKASGVYVLIRLALTVFNGAPALSTILMILGSISIVLAAFAAITQSDMKRMLSYSSISQVGYIILAVGCATPLAIVGAVFHFFNHATFKSLLFVSSAAVESATGTNDLERMGGLSQKMPVTGTASAIGFLSAAGIPPLAGFWSKLVIIIALWQAGHTTFTVIAVLASVVTLGYFLVLQRKAFFGKLAHGMESVREAGFWFVAPQLILSLISIAGGFLLPYLLKAFTTVQQTQTLLGM